MRHVAFFRNMNLGQARSKSPSRAVLEEAFVLAGATGVRSFQTNGTVLFDPAGAAADAVVEQARATLGERTGYSDIAPALTLAALDELLAAARAVPDGGVFATMFHGAPAEAWLPGFALDAGTEVIACAPGWLVTRVSPGGDPTTAAQRHLGRKATTRGLGTIERLIRAAGASG